MRITIKSIEYVFDNTLYTPSRYNDDVNEHQYRNEISQTIVYRNKSSGGKWAYGNLQTYSIYRASSVRLYPGPIHHMHPPRRIGNILKYGITKTFQFSILFFGKFTVQGTQNIILDSIERQFLFSLLFIYLFRPNERKKSIVFDSMADW